MPKLSLKRFKEELLSLTAVEVIPSITGRASYSNFTVTDTEILFLRNNTGNERTLNIENLYEFYREEIGYNTVNARIYIKNWVYSPACAILKYLDL